MKNKAIASKKLTSAMSNKAMLSYAEHLYSKHGSNAVYDYALTLPNGTVKYGYCKACEADAPSVDGLCMCCGQPVTFKEECTEPCIPQQMKTDITDAYNEAKLMLSLLDDGTLNENSLPHIINLLEKYI